MGRESLAENESMLFLYKGPAPLAFWMQRTTIPLTLIGINHLCLVAGSANLEPLDETPRVAGTGIAALELPRQSWQLPVTGTIAINTRLPGLEKCAPPGTSH